jgi:hypothetical protein
MDICAAPLRKTFGQKAVVKDSEAVLKKVWDDLSVEHRGFFDDLEDIDKSRYVEENDSYVLYKGREAFTNDNTTQAIHDRSSMSINS